jgi:hypothetical protein
MTANIREEFALPAEPTSGGQYIYKPPVSEIAQDRKSGGNQVSCQRRKKAPISASVNFRPFKKRRAGSFFGSGSIRKNAKRRLRMKQMTYPLE